MSRGTDQRIHSHVPRGDKFTESTFVPQSCCKSFCNVRNTSVVWKNRPARAIVCARKGTNPLPLTFVAHAALCNHREVLAPDGDAQDATRGSHLARQMLVLVHAPVSEHSLTPTSPHVESSVLADATRYRQPCFHRNHCTGCMCGQMIILMMSRHAK